MTPKQKEKWLPIHEKGKTHFIIYYGILRIGLFFALGLSLMRLIWDNDFTLSHLKDYLSKEWFWIPFRCLFFGITLGWLWWGRIEESFTKQEHT